MVRYTTRYVNLVSFIITLLIFIITINARITLDRINYGTLISILLKRDSVLVELKSNNFNQDTEDKNVENQNNPKTNNLETKEEKNKWKIMIPEISLEAEISEGTSKEIMDKFVGHFEETTKISGNVGLAAHNRGYAVNYFANIKQLKENDKIIYQYNGEQKTYSVIENKIIKDTDWSLLENTKDNRITLITCVENEPEYRRCVQAKETKE